LKVLVTGASRQPGISLAGHLVEKGYTVRALLDETDAAVQLSGIPFDRAPGSLLDPEALQAALDSIQVVFNCGLSFRYLPPRANELLSSVTEGTRNLLLAMARAGIEQLVHVGSAYSFGGGPLDNPGNEETPYDGGRFGLACLDAAYASQELVLRYASSRKVRAVLLAPTLVFGRGCDRYGPAAAIVEYAATAPGRYPGGGTNVIAASDVARAALKAFGRGKPGECYIVGGRNVTYRELLGLVSASLGVWSPERLSPDAEVLARGFMGSLCGAVSRRRPAVTRGLARMAIVPTFYSSEKASRELDFSAGPIEAAIEDTCRDHTRP